MHYKTSRVQKKLNKKIRIRDLVIQLSRVCLTDRGIVTVIREILKKSGPDEITGL